MSYGSYNRTLRVLISGGSVLRRHMTSSVKSSLFISDATASRTSVVKVDLDLERKLDRESYDHLQKNLKLRNIVDINLKKHFSDYTDLKKLLEQRNKLQDSRQQISEQMKMMKLSKRTDDKLKTSLMNEGRSLREKLKVLMPQIWSLEEQVMLTSLRLPNDLHPLTPENEEEILVDFEATENSRNFSLSFDQKDIIYSNISPGAYYLKDNLAVRELSLLEHFTDVLEKEGFVQISCPDMVKSVVAEGCGLDISDQHKIFTLEDTEGNSSSFDQIYHLPGVSMMSFAAFFMRTLTNSANLPLKLFAIGRNYMPLPKESFSGAVCQSTQIGIFGAASNDKEAFNLFQEFEKISQNAYKSLGISCRLVRKSAADLDLSDSLKTEIQGQGTSLNKPITLSSIQLQNDFISRRLMMKHKKNNSDLSYLYTVYGKFFNMSAMLANSK